jgi:serine/threonine protein phosphatase PrpC
MLCSDGVWELLEDATLVELASTSASLDDWRDRLQSLVKSSMPSGHDNFSAILIKAYMPDKNQDSGRELNTVRPLIPNKLR